MSNCTRRNSPDDLLILPLRSIRKLLCIQIFAPLCVTAAPRLVLRDFIGVVDFAVVDAAGVDVERQAKQRL